MTARLPTLEQAANHNCIEKRPEGPEAASSILGWKLPIGVSPQEDRTPPGSIQVQQATRHQELVLLSPSVCIATSPGRTPPLDFSSCPPSPKCAGKEKASLSPSVRVCNPREGS